MLLRVWPGEWGRTRPAKQDGGCILRGPPSALFHLPDAQDVHLGGKWGEDVLHFEERFTPSLHDNHTQLAVPGLDVRSTLCLQHPVPMCFYGEGWMSPSSSWGCFFISPDNKSGPGGTQSLLVCFLFQQRASDSGVGSGGILEASLHPSLLRVGGGVKSRMKEHSISQEQSRKALQGRVLHIPSPASAEFCLFPGLGTRHYGHRTAFSPEHYIEGKGHRNLSSPSTPGNKCRLISCLEHLERFRGFLDRPHPSGGGNHGSFSDGEPSEQSTS